MNIILFIEGRLRNPKNPLTVQVIGNCWIPLAFLPVVFMTVALVIRTALEDRTLQGELPGCKEYAAQETKNRLLPGIW